MTTAAPPDINFLYIVASGNDDGVYKIGIARDPEARLKQIKRTYEVPDAFIVETMDVPSREIVFDVENALHTRYQSQRASLYGGREWFRLSAADLQSLRSMYQSQSNSFAQAQAYFGLVQAAQDLADKAAKEEQKRQRQIDHNRKHGKRYDTSPSGVLKKYNDIKRKTQEGTLGTRFSHGTIPHPARKVVIELTQQVKSVVEKKTALTGIAGGAAGVALSCLLGSGTPDQVPAMAFFSGVAGITSGFVCQYQKVGNARDKALKQFQDDIERVNPLAFTTDAEVIKDNNTDRYMVIRNFDEKKQNLRNEAPVIPKVTVPNKDSIFKRVTTVSPIPLTSLILTLVMSSCMAGMSYNDEQREQRRYQSSVIEQVQSLA